MYTCVFREERVILWQNKKGILRLVTVALSEDRDTRGIPMQS